MNKRENERINRLNLKQGVLTHYGTGKCACVKCGFDDLRALSIDHIQGNGTKHRKVLKIRSLYKWLLENDFPEGYQTLCMNCQFIKSYRQDIPVSKEKAIAKRVRLWVELREQPFNIRDIMLGLGLEKTKRGNVRVAVCRLKKEGIIRFGAYPTQYKKCIKPVKVFGRTGFENLS